MTNPYVLFALALAGVIIAVFTFPFVLRLIAERLSGPAPHIDIYAMKVVGGQADGCIFYSFVLVTPAEDPMEDLTLTFQFSGDVTDHRFGRPNTIGFSREPSLEGHGWFDIEKKLNGECSVAKTSLGAAGPDLSETMIGSGRVIIHGTQVLPQTIVIGVYVVASTPSSGRRAENHLDFSYGYRRLDVPLRQSISVPIPPHFTEIRGRN